MIIQHVVGAMGNKVHPGKRTTAHHSGNRLFFGRKCEYAAGISKEKDDEGKVIWNAFNFFPWLFHYWHRVRIFHQLAV